MGEKKDSKRLRSNQNQMKIKAAEFNPEKWDFNQLKLWDFWFLARRKLLLFNQSPILKKSI